MATNPSKPRALGAAQGDTGCMNDIDSVRAPVVLRCSTRVSERQIAEAQEVPRVAWDDADELLRDTLKGALRQALGQRVLTLTGELPDCEAIGREPVHVEEPTELQDQMYREALRTLND